MLENNISGLPVEKNGHLVGILTSRDLRFERNLSRLVSEVMTKNIITCHPDTNMEQAKDLMHASKIEKLLVVDANGKLKGLITFKDMQAARTIRDPFAITMGVCVVAPPLGLGGTHWNEHLR